MIERQPTAPTLNLEDIVTRAKSGDQEAYVLLDGFLDRQLGRIFRTFGYRAPDLLQDAKIRVFTNLENFDPEYPEDLKERGFDVNFRAWTLTVGLNVRKTELRQTQRQVKQTTFDDNLGPRIPSQNQDEDKTEYGKPQIDYSILLQSKIDELIKQESRRTVVRLALQGKSTEEVAHKLGKTKGSVKIILSRARSILEKKLIFPAGFRKLSSFADETISVSALGNAATRGKIEIVRFLNIRYATPEAVERYKMTHRAGGNGKLDNIVLNQGYVLLYATDISNAEYYALLGSNLALRHRGRVYILPEDLSNFRANQKTKHNRNRILGVIPEGFKPITEFARTIRGRRMIIENIRTGKLPAVKVGHRWLTTQKAFNEWQASRKTPMKNNLHF